MLETTEDMTIIAYLFICFLFSQTSVHEMKEEDQRFMQSMRDAVEGAREKMQMLKQDGDEK